MPDPLKQAREYQAKLFGCLDEFFVRATGQTAISFSSVDNFTDEVHRNARRLGDRAAAAHQWLYDTLGQIYSAHGVDAFRLARQIGGLKLVQAGQRFTDTHLRSAHSALLYADTLLIPDPVAPWIESKREEERFRNVLLLQNAHAVLHLKPIVDADLPHLPLFVFPSWEKKLEEGDTHTQEGIDRLISDLLAHFVDPGIGGLADAADFARQNPDQFMNAIERHNLIVAPGAEIGAPIAETIKLYGEEVARWRSADWLDQFHSAPASAQLLLLLAERIAPQFHLLENSAELSAHPLIPIKQQAHYFRLLSDLNRERLAKSGLLTGNTGAAIKSLSSERLGWLSDVPVEALIRLRQDTANIEFRKRIEGAVGRLHGSALEDIEKVTAEVCAEIEYGIADHQKSLRKIEAAYTQKLLKTTGMALGAAACAFVPTLAPYIGPALPFAVAAKFGWDAWDRNVDKREQSRSLMGILAATHSGRQT